MRCTNIWIQNKLMYGLLFIGYKQTWFKIIFGLKRGESTCHCCCSEFKRYQKPCDFEVLRQLQWRVEKLEGMEERIIGRVDGRFSSLEKKLDLVLGILKKRPKPIGGISINSSFDDSFDLPGLNASTNPTTTAFANQTTTASTNPTSTALAKTSTALTNPLNRPVNNNHLITSSNIIDCHKLTSSSCFIFL